MHSRSRAELKAAAGRVYVEATLFGSSTPSTAARYSGASEMHSHLKAELKTVLGRGCIEVTLRESGRSYGSQ